MYIHNYAEINTIITPNKEIYPTQLKATAN